MPAAADEINGRLFETMLEYASFRLGPAAARDVFHDALTASGTTLTTAIDARAWARLDVFHAVADAYRPLLGDAFLADAITWAVPVRRDFSAMSLSAVSDPATVYRHLDRARSFFARHVAFDVEMRPDYASVTLRYRDDVPRRRDSCDVGRGILIAVPLLFGLPAAEVEEETCFARGAASCVFRVKWTREPRLARLGFAAGALAAAIGAAAFPHFAWVSLPLVGWTIGREVRSARIRRRMVRISEEHRRVLEANERDFERRYNDIKLLNEELEARVAARTSEIRSSMEELRERNAAMRETINQVNRIHDGVVEAAMRGLLGDTRQHLAREMSSPLSYLLANLDFLESATTTTAAQGDVPLTELAEVVRDARLGVDRVRSVLAWYLELRHDDMPAEPHDLDAELRSVVRGMEEKAAPRVRVHSDLEPLPPVLVRGKHLHQALVLLSNASLALARENVWVRVATRDDKVVLEVRNDGDGVAAEDVDGLFEHAVTASPRAPEVRLYITRAIVERHGGTISAHRDLAGGLTFEVVLPVVPSRVVLPGPSQPPPA